MDRVNTGSYCQPAELFGIEQLRPRPAESVRATLLPPHNGHILERIDGGSLTDPIRITDGHSTPPDQPGHGILFDRAVLAAHAVTA